MERCLIKQRDNNYTFHLIIAAKPVEDEKKRAQVVVFLVAMW
jgi:hypothetical protein